MATRFYFPETEAGAVAPTIDTAAGQWDSGHTGSQLNRRLLFTADASTLTSTAYTPDGADHAGDTNTHHRQYVSDSLPAQTIPASTWKAQFQGLQPNLNCNQRLTIKIYVVSQDGGTVRGVLSAISRDGDNEWATTLTNRAHSGSIASLAILANDRLVVEVGTGGSPGSGSGTQGHNATIRFGGDASTGDLPEDDASALTTRRPWIELSALITNAASGTDALPLGLTETAVISSQALVGTDVVRVTLPARPDPQQAAVNIPVFLASADTAALDVVAAHRGLDVAGAEGLAVGLTEADAAVDQTTETTPVTGADPLPVQVAETQTATISGLLVAGAETAAVGVAEDLQDDRDLASPLAVGLAEALAGQGTAAQAEALPVPLAGEVGVAADVSPVTEKAGTDPVPVPVQEIQAAVITGDVRSGAETLPTLLQEAAAVAGSANRPDSLATPLTEALSSLLGALVRPDSLPAGLLEAIAGLGTAAQAEALAAHLTELVALAATLPGTETLPVGLGELGATTGVAAITATDSVAAPVLDAAANLQGRIVQPDPVPLRLTGELTPLAVTLPGPESLALALLEALAAAVTLRGTETLPAGLTDTQVLAQLSFLIGADTLPMPVVEGTASVEAGGQINQAVAEALAVGLQELQTTVALLQRLDSVGVTLTEALLFAKGLVAAEAVAVGLLEPTEAFEELTGLLDRLALTLDEAIRSAGTATQVTELPVGLLENLTVGLAQSDTLAVAVDDALAALTALSVVPTSEAVSISLTEVSAILAAITAVRRIGTTTVEPLGWSTTVDAVIRSWEVEMASPFPYTVVPA